LTRAPALSFTIMSELFPSQADACGLLLLYFSPIFGRPALLPANGGIWLFLFFEKGSPPRLHRSSSPSLFFCAVPFHLYNRVSFPTFVLKPRAGVWPFLFIAFHDFVEGTFSRLELPSFAFLFPGRSPLTFYSIPEDLRAVDLHAFLGKIRSNFPLICR